MRKNMFPILTVIVLIGASSVGCKKSNDGSSSTGGSGGSGGSLSVFAGNGSEGAVDGSASTAEFNGPTDVAIDAAGNVYVADYSNNEIRKITPTGTVSTLAGNGTSGTTDGAGSTAEFTQPRSVAVDASGNVYVCDYNNNDIRKITPAGVVSTLAGNGYAGYADGTGTNAQFDAPTSIAVDASGNIYVADLSNQVIRKITQGGVVTTLAGSVGNSGFADGTGSAAMFQFPNGIAVDGSGNLYVSDSQNERIRKITPAGVVTTVAGNGQQGNIDGTAGTAEFDEPGDVAVDAAGNIYVADVDNNVVREISTYGTVSTLASGNGSTSFQIEGITVDAAGKNVYFADAFGGVIRKLTLK